MVKFLRDKMNIFIFLSFIITFLFIFILSPKGKISNFEKRKLEDIPDFSFKKILEKTYQKELEKSFSDNFFKREFFVSLNSYKNLLIKKTDNNGVYYAKDGFLIRRPILKNFSNFSKNIELINDFTNKINSKISVMIVPSPGFIMEDKLPFFHEEFFDKEFLDFFEKNKKGSINFIRLDDLFLKEKDKNSLFYRTDHHWTSRAAFIACNQYLQQNNTKILKKENFSIERKDDFFGTSYLKSGFLLTKPDEIELYNSRYIENLQIKTKERVTKGGFFKNFLNTYDKYPVFLGGNYDFLEIHNQNLKNDKRIVIIKDSYANCLAPFLSSIYEYIYMIDLRFYKESVSYFIKKQGINNILILYSFENIVSNFNINRLR